MDRLVTSAIVNIRKSSESLANSENNYKYFLDYFSAKLKEINTELEKKFTLKLNELLCNCPEFVAKNNIQPTETHNAIVPTEQCEESIKILEKTIHDALHYIDSILAKHFEYESACQLYQHWWSQLLKFAIEDIKTVRDIYYRMYDIPINSFHILLLDILAMIWLELFQKKIKLPCFEACLLDIPGYYAICKISTPNNIENVSTVVNKENYKEQTYKTIHKSIMTVIQRVHLVKPDNVS